MTSSISHVISWVASSHRTFTVMFSFPLSCFVWESKILTRPAPMVKSSRICTSSSSRICVGSAMYFLNCDTWKTLCKFPKCGGSAISYAAGPILLMIWYGLMNRGVNFLDLALSIHLRHSDTSSYVVVIQWLLLSQGTLGVFCYLEVPYWYTFYVPFMILCSLCEVEVLEVIFYFSFNRQFGIDIKGCWLWPMPIVIHFSSR